MSFFKKLRNRRSSTSLSNSSSTATSPSSSFISSPSSSSSYSSSSTQSHQLNENDFHKLEVSEDNNHSTSNEDLNKSYLSPPTPVSSHPLLGSNENSTYQFHKSNTTNNTNMGSSSSSNATTNPPMKIIQSNNSDNQPPISPGNANAQRWKIPNSNPFIDTSTFKCPVCSFIIQTNDESVVNGHVDACLIKAINSRPNMSINSSSTSNSISNSPLPSTITNANTLNNSNSNTSPSSSLFSTSASSVFSSPTTNTANNQSKESKIIQPVTFTYSSNAKPLFEDSPQTNRRTNSYNSALHSPQNSSSSSPTIISGSLTTNYNNYGSNPYSVPPPYVSNVPVKHVNYQQPTQIPISSSSSRPEQNPFAIQCPYANCKRNMEARDFYQHTMSNHAMAPTQMYACPVCKLMGIGNFTPNANTNLYDHVHRHHADLASQSQYSQPQSQYSQNQQQQQQHIPPRQSQPQQQQAQRIPISNQPPPQKSSRQPPVKQTVSSNQTRNNNANNNNRNGKKNKNRRQINDDDDDDDDYEDYEDDFQYDPADFVNDDLTEEEILAKLQEGIMPSTKSIGTRYVEDIANDAIVGKECTICFEEFEPDDKIARMDCFCTFHSKCIEAWFRKQAKCPLHKD